MMINKVLIGTTTTIIILLCRKNHCADSLSTPGNIRVGKTTLLPRDVKDAVSTCRISVQEALKQRISRMDIEFPVGTDFGIEAKPKIDRKISSRVNTVVTKQTLDRSDRELCRFFVDMFQPIGRDHIAAIFKDESLADEAKAKWAGESSAGCKVMSTGRRQSKEKKKNSMGFAAKLNAELESNSCDNNSGPFQLPNNCEVALFVSPGPKEFVVIQKICSNVGMGTLIVLLNARLGNVEKFSSAAATSFFQDDFNSIFSLAAAPQEVAPNCLLYHAFPNNDWTLARKPKIGPPKVIAVQPERFTLDDCQRAYNNREIEKGEEVVEGFLDNVANWFAVK